MTVEHLEILVEEPSMEVFLRALLPRLLTPNISFQIYPSQGKSDLLSKLPARLNGYSSWLPSSWRIIVVVDRDADDCVALKAKMETIVDDANLRSRSSCGNQPWQVVNRIAVEQLEAWYFGDWQSVVESFPRVSTTVPGKAQFRDPDGIVGGTWETFERELQKSGYFKSGLRKIEAARLVGARTNPQRNQSRSFQSFRDALLEATNQQIN